MNGIELNAQLQKQYPDLRVVILSTHANDRLIASLIKDGAHGYLTKNCDKQELTDALNMVHNAGYYINKATLMAIQHAPSNQAAGLKNLAGIPIELSQREIEVLELICKEYSTAEIAEKLFISPRTVEGHRVNMLQKTNCKNVAGLVLFAIRHSIYTIPF